MKRTMETTWNLNIRKINKVFENQVTKIRPEDLYVIADKKKNFLSQNEKRKLINMSQTLFDAQEGTDYLAIRNKKGVRFKRF